MVSRGVVASNLPTGTVTFLFTDIEGSTRLLSEYGEERYAGALDAHRRILRQIFTRHGGVEVDTQGDAFFYAFARVTEAVAAAQEAQEALRGGPVQVRMGVHVGEPHVTREGYVGIDVHRAARICAAAHGGQVLLSDRASALLDDGVLVLSLGSHRLKDLGAPERLYQLGDERFPPLRSLNATNLPAMLAPLIGREREMEEVRALVREHREVTLSGPGGSGKTRLALQVAAELAHELEDGVFWAPLAAVTDPVLVLPTIAAALGASQGPAEHIGEKRMLLLLDNLEQILDCAPALRDLLASCPNLTLLVTSRAPLRLSAEREYQVPPLPEGDAVTLFRERAHQAEPLDAVQEICRHLDGLPLAIELAAARTRILPPEKLLERLAHVLPILTGGPRDAPARQRTLRATIEWSYDLLGAEERALFARLAVFAGGFDLEAAEEVCDADLDALESLLDQSLIKRTGEGRFLFLETIRELALERLAELEGAEDIRRRHAEWVLALARSANLTNEAEGEQRHDLVIRDEHNVRTALDWAEASGEIVLGLKIAGALENYWVTNSAREGKRRLGELLERAVDAPEEIRALALRAHGASMYILGEFEAGARRYEEALAVYRRIGDERGTGIMLHRLAVEVSRQGDRQRSRALLEEALRLHRKISFARGEAQHLSLLGWFEMQDGHIDRAIELLEQSVAMSEAMGFIWYQASVLKDLGRLLLEEGRLSEAEVRLREALRLAVRIRDRQRTVYLLALLARVAVESGNAERAGRLWGAIEAEEARGPVGQWEIDREEFAAPVLAHVDAEFERGREEGKQLTLSEAVELALAEGAEP